MRSGDFGSRNGLRTNPQSALQNPQSGVRQLSESAFFVSENVPFTRNVTCDVEY